MSLPVFKSLAVADARVGDRILLEGSEGRHAATVKRIRAGEQIVLTDTCGTSATCTVVEAAKAALVVTVDEHRYADRVGPVVTVVQAIPKGDRGELAVEMLTEIDVDRIVPWAASRSVAVWKGERAAKGWAKWHGAADAAAKQSRRSYWPEIDEVSSTVDVATLIARADLAIVLHEAADAPLADQSLDGVATIVVVVGPEGGISEEELALFAGARIVKLGSSVLRTSTAGVAAVAALLSRTDRWR